MCYTRPRYFTLGTSWIELSYLGSGPMDHSYTNKLECTCLCGLSFIVYQTAVNKATLRTAYVQTQARFYAWIWERLVLFAPEHSEY